GALTREGAEAAWARVWAALLAVAADQAIHHADEAPAVRFLTLLRSAVASGAAHVAWLDGTAPAPPEAWGGRSRTVGLGDLEHKEWQPQGSCVGWVDGDDLYLDPAAAYAAAQRLGGAGGGGLTVQPRTLHKRLRQGGYLLSVDDVRGRLTI